MMPPHLSFVPLLGGTYPKWFFVVLSCAFIMISFKDRTHHIAPKFINLVY